MTPFDDADGPDHERPDRAELERQVRDHRRQWRDQPKGLGCLVISGFMVLTTIAFAIGLALLLGAMR